MATENLDGIYSLPAAADYSAAGQYCGVVANTSGQFVLAGVGVQPHGWLHNAPAAGAMARAVIAMGVVVKAKVGAGGVSIGVPCCVDAAGKLIGGATGNQYVGIPLRTGAANDVIELLRVGSLGAKP